MPGILFRQPAQTSSSSSSLPPPTTPPKSAEDSQKLINNVMNRPPEARQHPQVQSDLAQAQQVVQEQVRKLERQKELLSEAQKKELADAKATLARLEPGKPAPATDSGTETPAADAQHGRTAGQGETAMRQGEPRPGQTTTESSRQPQTAEAPQMNAPDGKKRPPQAATPSAPEPNNTTPYHPATPVEELAATNSQTAGRQADDSVPNQAPSAAAKPDSRPADNSQVPAPATAGAPPAAAAGGGQPPSSPAQPTVRPSTPPLSVERSQELIQNVSKMSAQAQQHPRVQADLAQARRVVAEAASKYSETPRSRNEPAQGIASPQKAQPKLPPPAFQMSPNENRGVHGAAAADEHMIPWSNNPDGKIRTVPEALNVFREHMKDFLAQNPHVHIDLNLLDKIDFQAAKKTLAPEGETIKWARYGPFYEGTGINGEITWNDLFDGDRIPVQVDPRVLVSDQAILGIFAHEMYEIQCIREKMRSNRNQSLPKEQLQLAINDFHTAAVRVQNRLVQFMKAKLTRPPKL